MKRQLVTPASIESREDLCELLRRAKDDPVVEPYGDIRTWDVTEITDFSYLMEAAGCTEWFNYDISGWKFGCVFETINLEGMFRSCVEYNQPFTFTPETRGVDAVNLKNMFANCPKFNSAVTFDDVEVTSTAYMFHNCSEFNAPVRIRTSASNQNIETCHGMFENCIKFNSPVTISGFHELTDMSRMFYECRAFNQPLDLFFRTKTTNSMMYACADFNQRLFINAEILEVASNMLSYCSSLTEDVHFVNCPRSLTIPHFIRCGANILVEHPPPSPETEFQTVSGLMRQAAVTEDRINTRKASLPWRMHTERWRGFDVPILVLPRGTLLFTGRVRRSATERESMMHLWKLAGTNAPSFTENNLGESLWTYFYPIPYMHDVIHVYFQTLDMVETTHDFRMMCLLQPSERTRGERNDTSFAPLLNNCPSRNYDLCFHPDCMRDLQLQGYIGIAGADSITRHYTQLDHLSLLTQVCAMCTTDTGYMLGIPEVVLLSPVLVGDLDSLDDQYAAASANQLLPKPVPFTRVEQFVGPNTDTLMASVHREFNRNDRWRREIAASRQAPGLFFVRKQSTSLDPNCYDEIDHVFTSRDYSLEISYRGQDSTIIVAIRQGGSVMPAPYRRIVGGKGSRRKKKSQSNWSVKSFGCMPIVVKHATKSTPSRTRRRQFKS